MDAKKRSGTPGSRMAAKAREQGGAKIELLLDADSLARLEKIKEMFGLPSRVAAVRKIVEKMSALYER